MPKKRLVAGVALFFFFLSSGVFPSLGADPSPQSGTDGSAGLQGQHPGADTPGYNDYARFIAGLKGGQGPLGTQEANPTWVNYVSATTPCNKTKSLSLFWKNSAP
jgi:hypothetical protein